MFIFAAPVVLVDAPVVLADAPVVLADAPVILVHAPVVLDDAPVVLVDAPVVVSVFWLSPIECLSLFSFENFFSFLFYVLTVCLDIRPVLVLTGFVCIYSSLLSDIYYTYHQLLHCTELIYSPVFFYFTVLMHVCITFVCINFLCNLF